MTARAHGTTEPGVREGPLLRSCVTHRERPVSALVAGPAKPLKVRELQRTLYRAAKADPGRRFHALYDKGYRRDVIEWAWELVRASRGAAGIDSQTITDVEEYGVAELLDELGCRAPLELGTRVLLRMTMSWGQGRPRAARRAWP